VKKIAYITSWGAGLQITGRHQAMANQSFPMFDKMPAVIGHYVAWEKCFFFQLDIILSKRKKKHICSLDGVNIK